MDKKYILFIPYHKLMGLSSYAADLIEKIIKDAGNDSFSYFEDIVHQGKIIECSKRPIDLDDYNLKWIEKKEWIDEKKNG